MRISTQDAVETGNHVFISLETLREIAAAAEGKKGYCLVFGNIVAGDRTTIAHGCCIGEDDDGEWFEFPNEIEKVHGF